MDMMSDFDLIVDAIFGFSIQGHLLMIWFRGWFVCALQENTPKSPVIVPIDIPSGWHVEEGDICGEGIKPDMLVSLIAPKLCAKKFDGPHHFLGG